MPNQPLDRKVTLGRTTLTFALPDDFGRGWGYRRHVLYGPGHAWAGSYDRSESGNFAFEALHRLSGGVRTTIQENVICTVDFEVDSMAEASAIQQQLQALVDAFPVMADREICVRGSHNFDSEVAESSADGEEVLRMPLLAYLVRHVPLSVETHPALQGEDIPALLAELEGAAQQRDEQASTGM